MFSLYELLCSLSLLLNPVHGIVGLLLGDGKQPSSSLHMDLQTLSSSSTQLFDSFYDYCFGNNAAFPVGFLSSGK